MHPGSEELNGDGVRLYLRRAVRTYHHPVGTCRIGEDTMAVVDADLRVRGIGGLRVVDASVMPSIVSVTRWQASMASRSGRRPS